MATRFIRIGNLLLPWALLALAWILGACLRLDRHRAPLTAALERVTPA